MRSNTDAARASSRDDVTASFDIDRTPAIADDSRDPALERTRWCREVIAFGNNGSSRPIRGRTGDVILRLDKSLAGQSEARRRIVRSLGLRKRGDRRLADQSDPIIAGQVAKVVDLIGVHSVGSASARLERGRPVTASIEKYGTRKEPGEFLVFDDGEYVQVERHRGRTVAVFWTAGATALEALQTFREVGGEAFVTAPSVALIRDKPEDQVVRDAGKSMLDLADVHADEMDLVDVDLGEFAFAWRAPFRKLAAFDQELAECTFEYTYLDHDARLGNRAPREALKHLIGQTATAGVVRKFAIVESHFTLLSTH